METNSIGTEEILQYRNETTGCRNVVHLNNAGTSMPPDTVVNTIVDYLREEALNGGYETEHKYIARINRVYELIAKLINADESEIAICENAGTAWGTAFKGLNLKSGDEIITSEMEYTSSVLSMIDARNSGVKISIIQNDDLGNFPLEQLEAAITNRTKLITIAHIPSSGGCMLPIEAIGQIAKKHQILYMVDACQSVGQYPIDVKAIGCDMLSATGRKYLRGPRGTAFLFVRKKIQDLIIPLLADDRGAENITTEAYSIRQDARRFELYEKSRALTLGLGEAVAYAMDVGVVRIWERIRILAMYARKELSKIPGVHVYDEGNQQCGIITFAAAKMDTYNLRKAIVDFGINVSFSSITDTPVYMSKRQLNGLVRASVHYYNTEEEIIRLCEAVRSVLL